MSNLDTIFVTTDFSPASAYAEGYAAALAKRLSAQVHLGHVVDTGYLTYAALYGQTLIIDPNAAGVEQAARKYLDESADWFTKRGLNVTAHLTRGTPVADMVKIIAHTGADLVVTGTHGYSGFNKFLFGSFCEKLLRQCPVPVLAVRQPAAGAMFNEESFATEHVVCTTDLSDLSRAAFPIAAELSEKFGAELTLLHVIDTRYESLPYLEIADRPTHEYLRERAAKLLADWSKGLGVARVNTRVMAGVPHECIDEFTRDHNTDLLIMSTHGHSGLTHALIGSTTERILRTAACPVISVRPH